MAKYFVSETSIVRKIWSKPDLVLFIFAGSAAEFAVNKAVDWLYFTGKLPSDPLGRLFSTLAYARMIIFSEEEKANAAISKIASIHKNVEKDRGSQIPDWAYRDVLYMLIYYTIAAHEFAEDKLTDTEKEDIYDVFRRMGTHMGLEALPGKYLEWCADREVHLQRDLIKSRHTDDLFLKYKVHLGLARFTIMKEVQAALLPVHVKQLLSLHSVAPLGYILSFYKSVRKLAIIGRIQFWLLPLQYRKQLLEIGK